MSVQSRAGAWVRRVGVTRLLRWPTARLTVLCGGRGSGKSASLRQIALEVCDQVKRQRRPQQMVVYVNLRALTAATNAPTVEMIREHLRGSVRAHDGAAAGFLEQHLERPRGLRWLFIFDSVDDLGVAEAQPPSGDPDGEPQRSASEKYLLLIEQLTKNRRDFRAVVAMRENPAARAFTGSVLTMADLSVRQQRALLRAFSITSTTHRSVFDRLAHDADLKDLAVNPLLLSILGAHLRAEKAIELKRTRYEIFEGIIGTRLQTAVSPEDAVSESEVRCAAERIAYRMFAERTGIGILVTQTPAAGIAAMDTVVATAKDAAMQALVRARLGWQDRSEFRFCHRAVQVHFAAAYLLSEETRADEAYELITSEAWRDIVITALQAGTTRFRDAIVQAANDVLLTEVATLRDLVPDVQTYLKNEQPPIMPGSFYWPPITRHVLEVLRNGLRFEPTLSPEQLPVATIDATDRLILTAVVAGGLAAKKDAVDQLPVASPEVGVWVAKRALDWNNKELAERVIQQLAVMPGAFRELGVRFQCFAVVGAFANMLVGPVLSRRAAADEDAGTLPGVLYNVLRVSQVFALGLGLWMIAQSVTAHEPFAFGWSAGLVLVAAAFLYDSGVPALRGLTEIGYLAGLLLVIVAVIAALVGVLSALGSVIALLTLDVGEVANDALFAYLALWPLAMTAYVVVDSSTARTSRFQEWLLPHVRLAQMTLAWLQDKEVRAAIRTAAVRRRAVAAVVIFALLLVIASSNLPGISRETEETVDGFLALVAFLVLFSFDKNPNFILRKLNWWKFKQKLPPNEVVDNAELLRLLECSGRSRDSTSRLLQTLVNAEHGLLRNAVPALTDLDSVLEFVKQMVPADTTTQIPGALWALGPNFTLPEFRPWLIEYDKRYPGRLTWLANSRRDLLAQVLHRAKERGNPSEEITVFRPLSHSSEPEQS